MSPIRACGIDIVSTVKEPSSDDVGRTYTGSHIAYTGGRQAANQDSGRAGTNDGAANVRHQNGHHRANVHIGQTGSGHSHIILAPTI